MSEKSGVLRDKIAKIEADIYFKARKYRKKHHKQFAMPVFHCNEWKKVQARR